MAEGFSVKKSVIFKSGHRDKKKEDDKIGQHAFEVGKKGEKGGGSPERLWYV